MYLDSDRFRKDGSGKIVLEKQCFQFFLLVFHPSFAILADNEDMSFFNPIRSDHCRVSCP